MLYFVKLNNTIIFKGNYYACVDFASKFKADNTVITARK